MTAYSGCGPKKRAVVAALSLVASTLASVATVVVGTVALSVIAPSVANADPVPAQAVASGSNHSCAIFSGALRCWGDNSAGQLGNGTNISSIIRVRCCRVRRSVGGTTIWASWGPGERLLGRTMFRCRWLGLPPA
jgi:Regulator of chromosome condensation (RCC1) repeat